MPGTNHSEHLRPLYTSTRHWLMMVRMLQLNVDIWHKKLMVQIMFLFYVILARESDTEQLRNKLCC